MKNRFEIIDDNGVLFSDDEDTIRMIFDEICDNPEYNEYVCDINGDLKMVEVHAIYR